MKDEEALLTAIGKRPNDDHLRLVYADWLEERGDSRGELIRIEMEMRRLPVFSDRFWELKPRRNQLRAAAPERWVRATGYGVVVPPTFAHGVPDGWRERWRLIREFTDRWRESPMPDVGGRRQEIYAVEQQLGRPLPPSVREWVAFAHDARRWPNSMVVIPEPYRGEDLEGRTVVCTLVQWGGEYFWVVGRTEAEIFDPPVFGFDDFDGERSLAASVSSFVLSSELNRLGGKGRSIESTTFEVELLRRLEAAFPIQSRINQTRLFETEDILIQYGAPDPPFDGARLKIDISRPRPRRALPKFLRAYLDDIPF